MRLKYLVRIFQAFYKRNAKAIRYAWEELYLDDEGGWRLTIWLYQLHRNEQFGGSERKSPKNRKPRFWRTTPPVARVFYRRPVKPRPTATSGIVLLCAPEK